MWATFTPAFYPYMYIYGKFAHYIRYLTPPTQRGDNKPTENVNVLGVVFDVDHDFEGPRAPKAHLDTVLTKTVTPPAQALYALLRVAVRYVRCTDRVHFFPFLSYGFNRRSPTS